MEQDIDIDFEIFEIVKKIKKEIITDINKKNRKIEILLYALSEYEFLLNKCLFNLNNIKNIKENFYDEISKKYLNNIAFVIGKPLFYIEEDEEFNFYSKNIKELLKNDLPEYDDKARTLIKTFLNNHTERL